MGPSPIVAAGTHPAVDMIEPYAKISPQHHDCESWKVNGADKRVGKQNYSVLVAEFVLSLRVVNADPVFVGQFISIYVVAHVRVPIGTQFSACTHSFLVLLSKVLLKDGVVAFKRLRASLAD